MTTGGKAQRQVEAALLFPSEIVRNRNKDKEDQKKQKKSDDHEDTKGQKEDELYDPKTDLTEYMKLLQEYMAGIEKHTVRAAM